MPQRLRPLVLATAFVAPAVLYRAAALAAAGLPPSLTDLAGLNSDLAVGLCLALLCGLMARVSRAVAAVTVAIWLLACSGNYEHVRALGANVSFDNLHYLADETFIFGSLPAVDWAALMAALAAAAVPTWIALRDRAGRLALRGLTIAAGVFLVVALVWTPDGETLRWRRHQFLLENLRAISAPAPSAGHEKRDRTLRGDLSGESWLPTVNRATNVLWLVLEGVSAAHVAPLARAQGWESSYEMPALSALSEESVAFTNFLTMQRQTNRGLYAMLCGGLPRLDGGTPRMSEYAIRGGEPCLPALLAQTGYATAFVQAAPLGFMMKDQFMPRAGFERTVGAERFRRAYRRGGWGVDDRAFLEQSLELIDETRGGGRPWFMTLLTSGTHHPFNVPESFASRFPAGSHARAAEYLDLAVGEFIEALRDRSVFEDTLVIVTSDESAGAPLATDPRAQEWSQNWGLALMLFPGAVPDRIETPHAQFDLPLSVLDYLRLEAATNGVSGRSMFRRYERPRPIAFANGYLHRVAALAEDDRLFTCDREQSGCRVWEVDRLRPFAPDARPLGRGFVAPPPFLAEALSRSQAALPPFAEEATFVLMRPGPIPLESKSDGFQWIFGGQRFEVPPATRVEIGLELRLAGVEGSASLMHDLAADGRRLFRRELPLDAGQQLDLRYACAPGQGLQDTVVRLWTRPDRPPSVGLSLEVLRAEMRLMPATVGGEAQSDGCELLTFEIIPSVND